MRWETLIQRGRYKALTLSRSVFPKATIPECRVYLFNLDPTKEPYSNLQVNQAGSLLGLMRKAASTTADLAFLPVNIQKRELYWMMPPLRGMRDVPNFVPVAVDGAVEYVFNSIQSKLRIYFNRLETMGGRWNPLF